MPPSDDARPPLSGDMEQITARCFEGQCYIETQYVSVVARHVSMIPDSVESLPLWQTIILCHAMYLSKGVWTQTIQSMAEGYVRDAMIVRHLISTEGDSIRSEEEI